MEATQTLPAIVQTIVIQAPAAKVFAALTEPEQLVRWWGSPETYKCAKMESDLRVGGKWRTTGAGSDGESFSVAGVYRAIDPPRLLEMTWLHDWGEHADNVETVVRYDLEEIDGATHLRLTHSGFTSSEARDDHEQGWAHVLAWLDAYCK